MAQSWQRAHGAARKSQTAQRLWAETNVTGKRIREWLNMRSPGSTNNRLQRWQNKTLA
jgi:hypothetical protein